MYIHIFIYMDEDKVPQKVPQKTTRKETEENICKAEDEEE